jgi:hypothetical protein
MDTHHERKGSLHFQAGDMANKGSTPIRNIIEMFDTNKESLPFVVEEFLPIMNWHVTSVGTTK